MVRSRGPYNHSIHSAGLPLPQLSSLVMADFDAIAEKSLQVSRFNIAFFYFAQVAFWGGPSRSRRQHGGVGIGSDGGRQFDSISEFADRRPFLAVGPGGDPRH